MKRKLTLQQWKVFCPRTHRMHIFADWIEGGHANRLELLDTPVEIDDAAFASINARVAKMQIISRTESQ